VNITNKDLTEAYKKLQSAKRIWKLLDDGETLNTHSSLLQPVVYKGAKAMLKIPMAPEECRGTLLMICWNGNSSAKVLRHDENALLMERAVGTKSLKQMVFDGEEDNANKIICDVASKLHASKCFIPELIPLKAWFRDLIPAAQKYGGLLAECSGVADELLSNPAETVVLHGDIHYGNILDSGTRGWVAIDPKGLLGERGFDFANLFCNPDSKTATSPGRLSRQVKLIAAETGLDAKRLLNWIVAWAGLSAAWALDDGEDTILQLTVAKIALKELDRF
jgi:streptomycin 6-kinase